MVRLAWASHLSRVAQNAIHNFQEYSADFEQVECFDLIADAVLCCTSNGGGEYHGFAYPFVLAPCLVINHLTHLVSFPKPPNARGDTELVYLITATDAVIL